jgi:cell filamentation protein
MVDTSYAYSYLDPENYYTYPESDTLRNKLDITDEQELSEHEYRLSSQRLLDLVYEPLLVRSMADVRKIHAHLFGELYGWAGEYRKVNISKDGKPFMALQSFPAGEHYIDDLLSKCLANPTASQNGHNKANFVIVLADVLDNLNYMHPFREGNGRTQREVLRSLALEKGYQLIIPVQNDERAFRLYMNGTVNSDVSLLRTVISENLMLL